MNDFQTMCIGFKVKDVPLGNFKWNNLKLLVDKYVLPRAKQESIAKINIEGRR